MKNWQQDLLGITESVHCEHVAFQQIAEAAQSLGFEYCAYRLSIPISLSNPRIVILNNYCAEWQARYVNEGYLQTDPIVSHGRRSKVPLIWSDKVFASTCRLWDEAQSFGLCVGWSQSSQNAVGVAGMLTLARSQHLLSATELSSQEIKFRWLVSIAHITLAQILLSTLVKQIRPALTSREIEVLKWTADGKTSYEVARILAVSVNTVKFHVKNAVAKLETSNKTAGRLHEGTVAQCAMSPSSFSR